MCEKSRRLKGALSFKPHSIENCQNHIFQRQFVHVDVIKKFVAQFCVQCSWKRVTSPRTVYCPWRPTCDSPAEGRTSSEQGSPLSQPSTCRIRFVNVPSSCVWWNNFWWFNTCCLSCAGASGSPHRRPRARRPIPLGKRSASPQSCSRRHTWQSCCKSEKLLDCKYTFFDSQSDRIPTNLSPMPSWPFALSLICIPCPWHADKPITAGADLQEDK